MEAVRKIIDHATGLLTIELPEEYENRKLEVIVIPVDDQIEKKGKPDHSQFFGKMQWKGDALAEQKKLRDEWE